MTKPSEAKEAAQPIETLKTTLGNLVTINGDAAFAAFANQPLRAAVSFRLKRILSQRKQIIEDFHQTHTELLAKFPSEENKSKLETELNELLGQDVEVEGKAFSLFDLGDAQIPAAVLMHLDWLIVE